MKYPHTITAAAAAAALLLSGCGAIQSDGEYKDAGQLRDAFLEAGGDCDGHADDAVLDKGGWTRTVCNGNYFTFEVYDSPTPQSTRSAYWKGIGAWSLLKGEKWVIASFEDDQLRHVQERLGGSLELGDPSQRRG